MIYRTLSDVRQLFRPQKDPKKKDLQLLIANLLGIYVLMLSTGKKAIYQSLNHF